MVPFKNGLGEVPLKIGLGLGEVELIGLGEVPLMKGVELGEVPFTKGLVKFPTGDGLLEGVRLGD